MVRGNLTAAMQGLAAVPLLVGFDTDADAGARGRIFSFDIAGDRHEEFGGYTAIGSGSVLREIVVEEALPCRSRCGVGALAIAVEALYDAADDDSATGGPDIVRQIFPTAVTVDADGAAEVPEADIAAAAPRSSRSGPSNTHRAPVRTGASEATGDSEGVICDDISVLCECRTDHARSFGVGA